jgi:hypothetical protein
MSGKPNPTKKRRFAPPPVVSTEASASDLRLLHQTVHLSLVYSVLPKSKWHIQGTTTLYVLDESIAKTSSALALHVRNTCHVSSLQVETIGKSPEGTTSLIPVPSVYHAFDPLANILLKPPDTYSVEDDILSTNPRYSADSQCSRGASGMMTGLRVASIASCMGELRIELKSTITANKQLQGTQSVSKDEARQYWKALLNNFPHSWDGLALHDLEDQLQRRSAELREKRISLISSQLADAEHRAFRITIQYTIPTFDDTIAHYGGIRIHATLKNPHIYTTVGVFGDHEGPRNWLPSLDSAAAKHRRSWQMAIQVTAPMREGLSSLASGETFGPSKTYLHDDTIDEVHGIQHIGKFHFTWLKSNLNKLNSQGPHVIPTDASIVPSIDSIWATHTLCTSAWSLSSARSMGFAVGPFKVLEDPEYFSVDDDNDIEEEEEEREGSEGLGEEKIESRTAFENLNAARMNGEGIRQAYFAPLFERKKLHENADLSLIPGTDLFLLPLTPAQLKLARDLDLAVTSATSGVPHRALSLMRDILAAPAYRTSSYTQIWIPNAAHGGGTSGALHCCPEVLNNPFLGGAIMDSRLLPPPKFRLPYHAGGRVLQFMQARCAIRGWIVASLPLSGHDDVGQGYLLSVIESCLMSLYERGHGSYGEGGAANSVYLAKRYAISCGLNSRNLDFLPIVNVDESELEVIGGIVGAIPTDDRNNDQLFRTAYNGTESHTSAQDEFSIRQVFIGDIVEYLERGTDKDMNVPLPSFRWLGSHLSLSFLSSNASSSSELGCGAVEFAHPVGGLLYRAVKSDVFRKITEGRAGLANLVRVIRASFIAALLGDIGEKKLSWENRREKKSHEASEKGNEGNSEHVRPPFVICVDKLLSKGGFNHTLFTSGIRILAGPTREALLRGTLVDVERSTRNVGTDWQAVEPEGYPNSFVRGASMPYLRVGAHVELGSGDIGVTGGAVPKGIQLHVMVEPAIPDGGISFIGPVTLRVVENEGQLREFVKVLNNGARSDWGPIFLHAKPVTTAKDQSNASGIIETTSLAKEKKEKGDDKQTEKDGKLEKSILTSVGDGKVFNDNILHVDGFQALELVRLTNRTPLLWIRVDPHGQFGGKISIFQPDASFGEMLFHDGDASAQIEAARSLAERPLRIQGSMKITSVHNAQVSELPVRLLGDCLRGSPALHCDLPHTPAVRMQAALCIGQWQNNKAPASKDSVDAEAWIGVNILMQYFKERYFKNGIIMPVKFSRFVVKKNEVQSDKRPDGIIANSKDSDDYIDFDRVINKKSLIRSLSIENIDVEEDEEYRVRSKVISALAAIRAQDGMTPPSVLKFLLAVLDANDASTMGPTDLDEAEALLTKFMAKESGPAKIEDYYLMKEMRMNPISHLHYVQSMTIADALLATCYLNISPSIILDPSSGKPIQAKIQHPIQPLLLASRQWLEWELYRETIRSEMNRESQSGIGGNCFDSVAACGVAAVSTLGILRNVTTDPNTIDSDAQASLEAVTSGKFYMNIFDEIPRRPDSTRAACAQAVACVCCAADRFESKDPPVGLLTALEFLLDNIIDANNSSGLRQTLSLLMLDSCTGKISSMQRVPVIATKSDLCTSGARFYGGPLGASGGCDNGSAMLMYVNPTSSPVANAVNDGARRGLRLLGKAGHSKDESADEVIVRVAQFASKLWRTINGHKIGRATDREGFTLRYGVCAHDGILRCSLLSLWQWIWPKDCYALIRVQKWNEKSPRYKAVGADGIIRVLEEEMEGAVNEEKLFEPLNKVVQSELDRQAWRGEMLSIAYAQIVEKKVGVKDDNVIGELLPPISRESAFKQGGWVTSTTRQRRSMQLDGGMAVTKVRLTVKGSD